MQTTRLPDTITMERKRRASISAGCYLLNKDNKLCIINKKWPDGKEHFLIPKGHVEGEETLEETAIRETIEESGYTDFELVNYLGSTTYERGSQEINIKTDHYFLAFLKSENTTERKLEEYQKDVEIKTVWMDMEEAFKILTYQKQTKIHDLIRNILNS